ncbi:hypothetical protein [Pedobacter aquatilis]|uniref:hypothetical protein n=1 Tax=Pedobacter aquatilis TaxID=351343 RepID=UPI00292CDD81|nr:hypothetical protein [Pedobacter aquatilis]
MDKELIEHIKDSLSEHEEVYTPGAWERFTVQEEKKRRGFVLWPLWSAAAVILVIGGFFVFNNNSNTQQQIAAKKSISKVESKGDTISTSAVNPGKEEVLANTALKPAKNKEIATGNEKHSLQSSPEEQNYTPDYSQNTLVQNNTNNPVVDLPVARQNENSLLNPNNTFSIAAYNNKKAELIIEQKKPAQTKLTFEDILARDSYANNQAKTTDKTKNSSKWEPGIFVAPSMGNDNKVNMNYGFSLSYNVADKLSISSGIAYTALSSTSNPSANNNNFNSYNDAAASPVMSAKGSSTVNSSKSLESVNANLRGINIPIELKYTISKKFYTGIGVSALAVLNNHQDNNYIVSSAQNRTVTNVANGYAEQQMLLVTERVSEPQTESTTAADKYIGFYNFSLGYKQKISGKKNFAVEPFLRLPMKTFSKDNLNLTNGGLRLKLDF